MWRMSRLLLLAALLTPLTVSAWGVEYNIQKDQALYGNLSQGDARILPAGIGAWACVPVATANSFAYLENMYPAVYNRKLIPEIAPLNNQVDTGEIAAVASTLASPAFMNTILNTGTYQDMGIDGKFRYIESVIPNVTTYAAQMSGTWTPPGTPGRPIPVTQPAPVWVQQQTYPTWQFLYNNLADCEDVEICIDTGTVGHALTLTGFTWNDVNNFGFVDQAEGASINYIDPANGLPGASPIWQNAAGVPFLVVLYNNIQAPVEVAVKESPVPEPSTFVLLGMGAVGVLGFAWRRRKAV